VTAHERNLVLVTGATGFVGCHTAAALQAEGHSIRILAPWT
jgi:nucleoside-diphosphate-sugar epimerase